MWMMVATTAGKQDKNNELCVQIWRRAERRSTKTKKKYKLCYNNRIDSNNSVQSSFFYSLNERIFRSKKCRTRKKDGDRQRKDSKNTYEEDFDTKLRLFDGFLFFSFSKDKCIQHQKNTIQSNQCVDLHQRIE